MKKKCICKTIDRRKEHIRNVDHTVKKLKEAMVYYLARVEAEEKLEKLDKKKQKNKIGFSTC